MHQHLIIYLALLLLCINISSYVLHCYYYASTSQKISCTIMYQHLLKGCSTWPRPPSSFSWFSTPSTSPASLQGQMIFANTQRFRKQKLRYKLESKWNVQIKDLSQILDWSDELFNCRFVQQGFVFPDGRISEGDGSQAETGKVFIEQRFFARMTPHRRERTELRRIIGCIASLQGMRSTKTGRQLRRVLGLTLKYNDRNDL